MLGRRSRALIAPLVTISARIATSAAQPCRPRTQPLTVPCFTPRAAAVAFCEPKCSTSFSKGLFMILRPYKGMPLSYGKGIPFCNFKGQPLNSMPMELKDRLKYARKKAGLTQVELAERAGLKQASISEIERGLTRSSGHLVKLAQICGVIRSGSQKELSSQTISGISRSARSSPCWKWQTRISF